jgi:hypothetical protein
MASVYGVNNTKKYITNPIDKVAAKEDGGKVRVAYDSYVFPANAFASGDKIELMKLPKGAKVVDAFVKAPSLGTTGIFDLGYKANGVDSADSDAFVLSADAGGQAVFKRMSTEAGSFKEFSVETTVELTSTEVTTAASGLTIEVAVFYVLE